MSGGGGAAHPAQPDRRACMSALTMSLCLPCPALPCPTLCLLLLLQEKEERKAELKRRRGAFRELLERTK